MAYFLPFSFHIPSLPLAVRRCVQQAISEAQGPPGRAERAVAGQRGEGVTTRAPYSRPHLQTAYRAAWSPCQGETHIHRLYTRMHKCTVYVQMESRASFLSNILTQPTFQPGFYADVHYRHTHTHTHTHTHDKKGQNKCLLVTCT